MPQIDPAVEMFLEILPGDTSEEAVELSGDPRVFFLL